MQLIILGGRVHATHDDGADVVGLYGEGAESVHVTAATWSSLIMEGVDLTPPPPADPRDPQPVPQVRFREICEVEDPRGRGKLTWGDVRLERDQRLRAMDPATLRAYDRGEPVPAAVADYKEALRAIPESFATPDEVVWPVLADFVDGAVAAPTA
ncbi:hypothetical protein [Azospirillum argentinense]|uniref:phage tail assembly chaperone n=1 Tax=Azospirillum argentinense TaxID=2970906 RepID=UPI0032DEDE08